MPPNELHPSPDPERVPLRAVAEQAKVSRMTVSLALRNHPSISVATRQRVQRIAVRLGYRIDPDIRNLMEKIRSHKRRRFYQKLAYLTAYEERTAWNDHPTQRMYFEGATRRAEDCGYAVEEFWLRAPAMSDKRLSSILHSRGIEGVLVAPLPVSERLFQSFDWSRFSAVELGYSLHEPALHRACNHQYQSMLLLVRKLYELGYRRPGLAVSLDQDNRVNHHWRAAYFAGRSLWGANVSLEPLITHDWEKMVFARWLESNEPDVVVTVGPDAHDWLKELGYRTPQDIGLANVDLRPHMIPHVTGFDQNSRLVGAAAIDLLVSLLRHSERGVPEVPRITMVEGVWRAGRTTCARSAQDSSGNCTAPPSAAER